MSDRDISPFFPYRNNNNLLSFNLEEERRRETEGNLFNFLGIKRIKFINSGNAFKGAMKAPFQPLMMMIKEIGGHKKLYNVNLKNLVGGIEINKLLFDFKLYQMLCIDKEELNKDILVEPNQKNKYLKILYYYLLTRPYEELFKNYYENNNCIQIKVNGEVKESYYSSPTFKEALNYRKDRYYKKYEEEKKNEKIREFENATKLAYDNFKNCKSRNPRIEINNKVTIKKFEDFKLGEDVSIIFLQKKEEVFNSDDIFNDQIINPITSNNNSLDSTNSNNIINEPIRHSISSNNNRFDSNNSDYIIEPINFFSTNSDNTINDTIEPPIFDSYFNYFNNMINDLLRSPTPSNNTSFEPSNSNSILNDPIRHPISSYNNNSILNFNNYNNIINAPLRSPTPSNN